MTLIWFSPKNLANKQENEASLFIWYTFYTFEVTF